MSPHQYPLRLEIQHGVKWDVDLFRYWRNNNFSLFHRFAKQLTLKKLFPILDNKDGFCQNKLDRPLPSASEVFQQKNIEAFGDITGVHVRVDDLIIAALDKKEHAKIF